MLTKAQLRDVLQRPQLPDNAYFHGDVHVGGGRSEQTGDSRKTPAAVLIGIMDHGDHLNLLLTKRTSHLRDHGGQVAFPGGQVDPEDADSHDAALREAQEEVGLSRDHVEVLGTMSPYRTVTGFEVTPVIGWIRAPVSLTPDPFEVADIFEIPLQNALSPDNHERRSGMRNGAKRDYFVIDHETHFIWGATAAMIVNFSRLLEKHGVGV